MAKSLKDRAKSQHQQGALYGVISISNNPHSISSRIALVQPAQGAKLVRRLQSKLGRKSIRRRVVRFSFVAINFVLLVAVTLFVLGNRSSGTSSHSLLTNNADTQAVSNPLDQLSSADIAVTVARMDNLEEIGGVTSQATSNHIELASATTSTNNVAVKPQIAASAFKSNKDIQTYVSQPGDTLASVGAKFGITSDSVKWSNGLGSAIIPAGTKLLIPPMSGIVYTVKAGDTPDSLAQKYKASKDELVAANDAELAGFQVGEQIIIPNGQQPAPVYSYSFVGSVTASYAGNEYDFGWCTWYVYNRRAQIGHPVPSNLGDARTWYTYASAEGLATGTTPRDGAVLVNQPGDHVAVVEQVNADGSFWISEMNSYGQISITDGSSYGGWDRIDYKLISAGAAGRYYYIY